MEEKLAVPERGLPKTRRVKRQMPTYDDGDLTAHDASPAKRPRGHPTEDSSVQPVDPRANENTPARNLRNAMDEPLSERNLSMINSVPAKAPRMSREKRPRRPSPSGAHAASTEDLEPRSRSRSLSDRSTSSGRAKSKRSAPISRSSSHDSSGVRIRTSSSRCSWCQSQGTSHCRHQTTSSSAATARSERGRKQRHADSDGSSSHRGSFVEVSITGVGRIKIPYASPDNIEEAPASELRIYILE
ncbi:hypothetical protein HPB50_009695 [Hyalomma asiaticum]|uniref:Uncharacterized protein n=1 Tax=Hyalomma asiaticum TaxID=266040 RepID=A0ACB7TK16_HYAAI|nr:hypothetical protein HPB50_009695 [Hyalomma asiaticum]